MADGEDSQFDAAVASAAQPTSEFQCLIDYYMQAQLYRTVQRICEDMFDRGGDDDVAHFWHAVALTAEGGASASEAIRELDPLQNVPELALAVNAALISAHKTAKSRDKESMDRLKEKLKKLSRESDDEALVYAGRYFLLLSYQQPEKAKQSRQCLEKVNAKNPDHVPTLVMLGQLNLNSEQAGGRQRRQALGMFERALQLTGDQKDIGALLGRSKYYERSAKSDATAAAVSLSGSNAAAASSRKKWDRVLDDLNQVIVAYPNFMPAILEKARVLMLQGQWDESLLQAQRVLKRDPKDVSALRLAVLFHLTRESLGGKGGAAIANKLNELMEAIEYNEPNNHALMYDVAQLVCRLANRNKNILRLTLVLIERACRMEPQSSAYLTEQGYQLMLLDDLSQASLCFQEASKLDEGNIAPLAGLIKTKIISGNLKEAQQELEFLAEISASIGSNADLTFLHALLAWLKDGDEARCMEYLNACMMEHGKALEDAPLGFGYFVLYNPDFVLEVVQQYMAHVGTETRQPGDPPNEVLQQAVRLLAELTEMVPAMIGAQLLLSKALFLSGQLDESEQVLVTCLRLDPQCAPAHIIQAQICLTRENFQQCSQALEQARSLDFEIRNTPIYHLMKTKLLEASGQVDDALKVLQAAMELPGVRKPLKAGPGQAQTLQMQLAQAAHNPSAAMKGSVPLQDRISIFLELATVLAMLGQPEQAAKVMQDARAEFKHTTEATRILIADADLAVKRRDFDGALKMLASVPPSSSYATRAKVKAADIYLLHKKNKKAYAACYHELAQAAQSIHGFMLLGEAYQAIQEPEKAIKAYEAALKLNPGDAALSSRIGRALITTHDYKKAVQYYETAAAERYLEDGSPAVSAATRLHLLHDLAELYLSLKQYADVIRVLEQALAIGATKKRDGTYDDDVAAMIADVRSLSIWADVGVASQQPKLVVDSLTAAWSLQVEVLGKMRAENPDAKRQEREVTATLCFRLAEYYRSIHQLDKALQFYNEALKYNEAHEKSRLALARLHLINSDLDACQAQCVTLMRLDPNNKEASLMLADLMFRKNEHEAATFHFQSLLEKNPTRYDALSKLIQLLRRAGRLTDAPRFIKLAEKFNAKATFAPGLHYVKGLYAWYTNDPKTALSEFNRARQDSEWGKQATMNMVDIYINPDGADLFAESNDAKGDNAEQLAAAEKLLEELKALTQSDPSLSLRVSVLEAYMLMASKNKSKIEQALNQLLVLVGTDATRDYVPALLCMANVFVLRSEPAKARNQLKRISKMPYDPEYSRDFERSWLMLADIYIGVGKYEFAQELCKKTLAINKSSAKSWEMLGQIMEKEQAYKDAAEHYEHAWTFMHETAPAVGYKLAFNYLKAKRFVEAIDVCHKVLKAFPEYPKIRKEILAKAREALRP